MSEADDDDMLVSIVDDALELRMQIDAIKRMSLPQVKQFLSQHNVVGLGVGNCLVKRSARGPQAMPAAARDMYRDRSS